MTTTTISAADAYSIARRLVHVAGGEIYIPYRIADVAAHVRTTGERPGSYITTSRPALPDTWRAKRAEYVAYIALQIMGEDAEAAHYASAYCTTLADAKAAIGKARHGA